MQNLHSVLFKKSHWNEIRCLLFLKHNHLYHFIHPEYTTKYIIYSVSQTNNHKSSFVKSVTPTIKFVYTDE